MSAKPPKICWVDIPADNTERSKKFYSQLFGWKIEKEPNSPDYNLITIPDQQESTEHPHFLGGLLKRQNPQHTITIYINVPSIDTYTAQVKKLGGQVLSSKTPIAGWGFYALCKDTENNTFALWEENRSAR